MPNQLFFILEKDLETKNFLCISIKDSTKVKIIKEKDFFNFCLKSLYTLSKSKLDSITIYVCDLSHIVNYNNTYSKENPNILFDSFTYKSTCYSIIIKDLLYPKKFIIFKDYYNFVSNTKSIPSLKTKLEQIHEIAQKMFNLFQINIHKRKILSLAALSYKIFRKISTIKAKAIIYLNSKEDTYIRKAYYGGRTEVYQPIVENAFYYDVNSLYPFIMKNFKLPIGKPMYKKAQDITLTNFYGFINVLVSVDKETYLPILPIRSKNNHSDMGVLYPTGTFRGIYFSEELKLALDNGYKILKIYDGYEFNSDIIFDTFVDRLYRLRLETPDNFMKKIYKKIMNSLYGKFATVYTNEVLNIPMVNKHLQFIAIKRKYKSVAISAAITAYARCYMFNLVSKHVSQLLYWDTDGIMLKIPLNNDFIGSDLGKLRLVTVLDEVVIVGTKFYMYRVKDIYTYVFRGITIGDYLLNGYLLSNALKNVIIKNTINKRNLEIVITLKTINHLDKLITITFSNKREVIIKNGIISTKPWQCGIQ